MSNQSAGKEVTEAIASSSSGNISRIVDAASSSKKKRRELAEAKARHDAELKAAEEAVRVPSLYSVEMY